VLASFAVALFVLLGAGAGDPFVLAQAPDAAEIDSKDVGSIALKLAPGAQLAEKPDGTFTVIQDWESLASSEIWAGKPGLALKPVGRLQRLGIEILEPDHAEDPVTQGDVDLEAAAGALRLMSGVLWAEVSRPLRACLTPDDPYYPAGYSTTIGQWGPRRVGLPMAWDITTGSADVVVAILDSGLRADFPDFSGRVVSPYSVLTHSSSSAAWQDNLGHGTAVAGVAVAQGNNGEGIAGAAWNVKIMPVKISEAGESDTAILAEAIQYAVDEGADVINISFSGRQTSHTLTAAVGYAVEKGVAIVAAAGNDGAHSVSYPAGLPGVIAVGATGRSDTLWPSSNTGDALDIVAPGDDIISYSLKYASPFAYWDGTSLSSPLVAGVVGLMLSVDSSISPDEVAEIIAGTADDLGAGGWDKEHGWGLLNAGEAVERASEGSAVTTTTTTTTMPSATSTTTTTTTTTTTVVTSSTSTTTTTGSSTTTTTEPQFVDVSQATTPYWNEIGLLASLGVIAGGTDGLFRPEGDLLRQQFAKIIVRACAYPVLGSERCPFVDVVAQTGLDPLYPYRYVAVAYQYGITKGTDFTHFSPYRTLTRAQMITMVARAAGLGEPPAGYDPPFPMFSSDHYASARAAAYAGLLDGLVDMGPDYNFLAPATRGEVCAVVLTLLQ